MSAWVAGPGSQHPDPQKFPEPHTWATWLEERHPQFKTHRTLGTAKNAVTGKFSHRTSTLVGNCYIYRWDEDLGDWVEEYFIPHGATKEASPIHAVTIKRETSQVRGPSQKAVDQALASIQAAIGTTDQGGPHE